MLHWSGLMFKMTIRVNNSYLMIHLPLKIIMIINALELIIIFVITIATPIIFIILLKVSPRCNFGQTSFSQPGGNTWHLHRGTFLHPLQHPPPPHPHFHHHYHHPDLILINIVSRQNHPEITRTWVLDSFNFLIQKLGSKRFSNVYVHIFW